MKMQIKKPKLRKGFTLIELLIVVAIIGILAVALVPTITDAPARARDAARKAAVNSVLTALESYNIDNGSYPSGNFCLTPTITPANAAGQAFVDNYLNGNPPSQTAPGATTVLCEDGGRSYVRYQSTTSGYNVFIQLEKAGNASLDGSQELEASYNSANAQVFLVER